ncbi:hypothetical protein [Microbaculum marinum]|uniref:Uncharacterized protein n=1 Tax=Microbaculum marinum TaxID=1764581 RepID=A0AAW9RE99_9HYPH
MPDLKIFFITNRNVVNYEERPWFGSRFNRDGPHALRFGVAYGKRQQDDTYPYVVEKVEIAPEHLTQVDDDNRVVGSRVVLEGL